MNARTEFEITSMAVEAAKLAKQQAMSDGMPAADAHSIGKAAFDACLAKHKNELREAEAEEVAEANSSEFVITSGGPRTASVTPAEVSADFTPGNNPQPERDFTGGATDPVDAAPPNTAIADQGERSGATSCEVTTDTISPPAKSEGDPVPDCGVSIAQGDNTTGNITLNHADTSAQVGVKGERGSPCQQRSTVQKDFCRGDRVAGPLTGGAKLGDAHLPETSNEEKADCRSAAVAETSKGLACDPAIEAGLEQGGSGGDVIGGSGDNDGDNVGDNVGGEAGGETGGNPAGGVGGGESAYGDRPGLAPDEIKAVDVGPWNLGEDPDQPSPTPSKSDEPPLKADKPKGKRGRPPSDTVNLSVAVTPRAKEIAERLPNGKRGRMVSDAIESFEHLKFSETHNDLLELKLQMQQLIELVEAGDQLSKGEKWRLLGDAEDVFGKLKKLFP